MITTLTDYTAARLVRRLTAARDHRLLRGVAEVLEVREVDSWFCDPFFAYGSHEFYRVKVRTLAGARCWLKIHAWGNTDGDGVEVEEDCRG